MISVLFVGLASHLRGGVVVWERVTQTTQALQRRRVALELLERDLANAIVYDARKEAYEDPAVLPKPRFGADQLAWFTVQPGHDGPARVRYVKYWCGERNGTKGLWRTSQSIGEVRTKATTEPEPQLLMAGCEAFPVRYAYESGTGDSAELDWKSEWNGNDTFTLPRLVEASIRLTDGLPLRQLISIPQGMLGKEGGPPPGKTDSGSHDDNPNPPDEP